MLMFCLKGAVSIERSWDVWSYFHV